MVTDEFRAMNTGIVLAAEGEPAEVATGLRQARDFIAASEARFTRFSAESELSRLNAAAGRWFPVSPEMFELLIEARQYVEQTDGLFNPAILDVLEEAGYDRSMDEIRALGGVAAATPTRPAGRTPVPDFGTLRFALAAREVWLPHGMRLDLGGIAKGWIAEHAARVLARFSRACAVSAGGDIAMLGLPDGADHWPVAIEDPRDPALALATLHVGPGAVATSAVTKRRWLQAGHEMHHLIDPRRGVPARTEWLSVTVVARHAPAAEVFAKALLIAGRPLAESLAARHPEMIYFAVDRHGQLWGSRRAGEVLHVEQLEAA